MEISGIGDPGLTACTAAATFLLPGSSQQPVKHVWFEGWDSAGPDSHFLVSIPLDKALGEKGDVILALQMNGRPLPGKPAEWRYQHLGWLVSTVVAST
jgi:DMSO/TMAO reductase YedYZ molybdopterin-dependent catalytic subunit